MIPCTGVRVYFLSNFSSFLFSFCIFFFCTFFLKELYPKRHIFTFTRTNTASSNKIFFPTLGWLSEEGVGGGGHPGGLHRHRTPGKPHDYLASRVASSSVTAHRWSDGGHRGQPSFANREDLVIFQVNAVNSDAEDRRASG